MPRTDLLALSSDDLVTLTNRGTVKRATRELEKFECEIQEEDDGTVRFSWSDGPQCFLPGGATLQETRCSCPAPGLCRHAVRSVLAYQAATASTRTASTNTRDANTASTGTPDAKTASLRDVTATVPWDPGTISDEDLAGFFQKRTLTRLRTTFEKGALVEVVRAAKPSARFFLGSATIRFLVPGDARYSHCSCEEAAPCKHVPLAVWAFRELPADRDAGIIERGADDTVDIRLLDDLEKGAVDLCQLGLSGTSDAFRSTLRQLETRCRTAGLVWPAEILDDLLEQHERYRSSDARFAPPRLVELLGELLIRSDAIRNATGAVPQTMIRGGRSARETNLGSARLLGLGCGVQILPGGRGVEISAYLQDAGTGTVMALRQETADPAADASKTASAAAPRSFAALASQPLRRGLDLRSVGGGQLLIQRGKASASHRLGLPARTEHFAVHPSAFEFEALRAPVAAEDLAEVAARLRARPPAALRPRWVADDVFVCPVELEGADFSVLNQAVMAAVQDQRGHRAHLIHPYTVRGREGCELFLAALAGTGEWQDARLTLVSGRARLHHSELVFEPLAVIFETPNGRRIVQPWVDSFDGEPAVTDEAFPESQKADNTAAGWFRELETELGEIFVSGVDRVDVHGAGRVALARDHGNALGANLLLGPVERLAAELERKRHEARWDSRPAATAALELAVLLEIGRELLG